MTEPFEVKKFLLANRVALLDTPVPIWILKLSNLFVWVVLEWETLQINSGSASKAALLWHNCKAGKTSWAPWPMLVIMQLWSKAPLIRRSLECEILRTDYLDEGVEHQATYNCTVKAQDMFTLLSLLHVTSMKTTLLEEFLFHEGQCYKKVLSVIYKLSLSAGVFFLGKVFSLV
jgi:hypothetical protein